MKKKYFQGNKRVTRPVSIGQWVPMVVFAFLAICACVAAIAYATRDKSDKTKQAPVGDAGAPTYYIDIDPDAGWLDFGSDAP